MTKRSELTGLTFGKLIVLGLSEVSRNGHTRWHVKCDCGTEKTCLGTHLIQGKTISCGCHGLSMLGKIQKRRAARHWKGCGKIPSAYFNSVLRGAKGEKSRQPLEFSVTIEYINELYEKQGGLCKYSGLPIDFISRTASLDRIDSSKGYIEGNVQWLHKDVNMMKRHYSEEYFVHLCKRVTNECA